MERGRGCLNDLNDLNDVLDGFKKYVEICETIKNMDDQDRFSTIAVAIEEYRDDSDKTLDGVLSEFKNRIESVNQIINLLCSR